VEEHIIEGVWMAAEFYAQCHSLRGEYKIMMVSHDTFVAMQIWKKEMQIWKNNNMMTWRNDLRF